MDPVLSDSRENELTARFGPRLRRLPFTTSGIPDSEEMHLTKDIWAALTQKERQLILENTTRMVAEKMETDPKKVPDQTPYAMRLTHRYLQSQSKPT